VIVPADNKGVTGTPPPLTPAAPPAAAPVPAGPVLSEHHLRQLEAARVTGKKIARAVAVARFDGWSIAVVAALTLLFGFTSVSGVLMAAGLGAVAFFELRGATALRRLDAAAARTMGINQIALGALLVVYACWRIYATLTGPGVYAEYAATDAQLGKALAPIEDLMRLVTLAANAGLIAVSLLAQGGLAAYYFSRVKHVQVYLAQTPAWVVAIQKSGSTF
jgi:hypothetical protein